MANENLDLTAAFIADIEKKIAALQAILVSLKSASAIGALGAAVEGIDLPSTISVSNGDLGQPIDLPEGAFLGKSVPACIKLYLSAAKKKKTIKEIAAALKEGGVESTSDSFENVVTGAINRLKVAGEVLRFKDGWGLPEWYPAHIRAAAPSGAGKRTTKKKGKKSGRKNAAAQSTPASGDGETTVAKGKINDRILEFLRTKPEREYSLEEIAKHVETGINGVRMTLGKLTKAGRVKISAPGMYVLGKPQLMAAGD
jgi:hypothetical protein